MAEYGPRPSVREICEDNIHRKLEYINKANASLLSAYEAGRSDALEFCLDFIIKNVISNESKKELSRDRRIMRDMHSRWKNFHKSTQKYDAPSDEKSLAYLVAGHDTTTTRYRDDRKELLSIKALSKYCATVAHDVWIP